MKLPEGIGFTADCCDICLPDGELVMSPEKANSILPALFEAWVRAEGVKVFGLGLHEFEIMRRTPATNATHQAYLMLPERIEK